MKNPIKMMASAMARIPREKISEGNNRLRDEKGDDHQRSADQQTGRDVDIHSQLTGNIEPLDDLPQNAGRPHDHFDHDG